MIGDILSIQDGSLHQTERRLMVNQIKSLDTGKPYTITLGGRKFVIRRRQDIDKALRIRDRLLKEKGMRKTQREYLERDRQIWRFRKAGYTLQQIGDLFGLGKERVRQICFLETHCEKQRKRAH